MSEAQLQAAIIELAQVLSWRVAHFRPAQTQTGRWVTPVAADGAGFPDLCMARAGQLVFAEIKSARGTLSPAQVEWACELQRTPAAHHVWKPEAWLSGEIEAVLRG